VLTISPFFDVNALQPWACSSCSSLLVNASGASRPPCDSRPFVIVYATCVAVPPPAGWQELHEDASAWLREHLVLRGCQDRGKMAP
jgi:hypothetical protein